MSLLFINDVGVHLVISTSNTAIPETATLFILIEKPSGVTVKKSVTPGMVNYTTGVITYGTVDGDLSESGEYKVQVHAELLDGTDEMSNIDVFTVNDKLIETV